MDIQEQFFSSKYSALKEAYRKIKNSPARWDCETVIRLRRLLRFPCRPSAAQDAKLFSYVSDDFVKEMGFIPVQTKASTDEYLTRPDYDVYSPEDQQKIIKRIL